MSGRGFEVCHLNIRSLVPKFDEFIGLVEPHRFDIITLSETWLSGDVDSARIAIDGYGVLRNDRVGRGGGVAAYFRNDISAVPITVSHLVEQLWFSFVVGRKKFAVGVAYRPPNFDRDEFLNELENTLAEIIPTVDRIIIMGDLNIDMLDPTAASARSLSRSARVSGSLIDLFFFNC